MGEKQVVAFWLDRVQYAIPIDQVQEIINVPKITRVPRAPENILGVLNLRGRILPVIDLKKRLSIGETRTTLSSRIVVAKVEEILIGILVDEVEETTTISDEDVENVPPTLGVGQEYICGIAKYQEKLMTILDLAKIIGRGEKLADESRLQADKH